MAWTEEDQRRACYQGWALFNFDREDGPDLQRLDSVAEGHGFPDDDAAYWYVKGRAAAGDTRARRALRLSKESRKGQ